MDGLLSQSGRAWVKVDGHSTKSGRSLGINRSVEVIGPKESNGRFKSGLKIDRHFQYLSHNVAEAIKIRFLLVPRTSGLERDNVHSGK